MKIKLSDALSVEADDVSNPEPGDEDCTLVRLTRDVDHVRAGEIVVVNKPYREFLAELHVATIATIREQRQRIEELTRHYYEDDTADLRRAS